MGADGGSIPRRDEMVRTKKAPEKPDPNSQMQAIWFKCALSRKDLKSPVVSCALGKLYNKDAILEFLLSKGTKSVVFGDADVICSHIASLKDIVTLNLTVNPTFTNNNNNDSSSSTTSMKAQFICPITQKEMNGTTRFSYLATCGCVFSEQALKELTSSNHNNTSKRKCLSCETEYESDKDVIIINPATEEEKQKALTRVQKLKEEEAERKRLKKAQKKAKKESEANGASQDSDEDSKKKKKRKSKREGDHDDDDDDPVRVHKKPAKNTNINISLPDLSSLDPVAKASDAVKSLYSQKGQKQEKMNFLISGTFNRYGGTF